MKEITTVGVDLAKSVFTVHGVDAMGRVVLRKTVWREQLVELIAGLPPCLIGMEACGGAHEWGRKFQIPADRHWQITSAVVRPRHRENTLTAG